MQIITTAVIKGGTGKTATAVSLAQAAMKQGRRVLCVDLDPQANMTYSLAADQNQPGAYQLLNGTPAADLIQNTAQGVAVIPASPDLATIRTTPGSANRLREALEPLKRKFDICVIDTPPTLGELIYNALNAATGLIVPLETDTSSLQGLYQIVDIAHQMQRSNQKLAILGVVLARYDARTKINKYLRDVIAEKGAEIGAPLLMAIRSGVAIREAAAMQQNIYEYAPNSKPAADYMQLYKIITKKK